MPKPLTTPLLSPEEMNALLHGIFPTHEKVTAMIHPMVESAQQNKILASLPFSDCARLAEDLKMVDLAAGQVIYEAGEAVEFVYFPIACTMSLVAHTAEGDTAELALIGQDGMVGVSLALGCNSMNHRVVVYGAGRAFKMSAKVFLKEVAKGQELQQLALCYAQVLITQISQAVVCMGHHSVLQRLSSWLLFNQNALDSNQVKVTHNELSDLLGVLRETVTVAMLKLQALGLASNGRGKINILNRAGLTTHACDCRSLVDAQAQRLFGGLTNLPKPSLALDKTDHQPVAARPDLSQKHQDAYEFAPVSFVSLDKFGQLIQTNLAGASMLNVQRFKCNQSSFVEFISPADQAIFKEFHLEVLSGKCRRPCELTLRANANRAEIKVRIEATLNELGNVCQLLLIDVTEHKAWQSNSYSRNTIGSGKARLTDHFSLMQ